MPPKPAQDSDRAAYSADATHRLERTYERAKEWREITSSAEAARVHPNSSLGADDRLFTVVPISHLAWHGISHAVDHLDMYLNALVEHRMSFAIAPQSLARSGLLGAAHALWLLDAPSRRERQLRGLRIAYEEWRNERNAYQKLIDSDQAVAGMKGLVDVRTEWMKRAIMAGESIGFESRDVTTKPKDTDLIEEVIARYEQHVPSEPGACR